MTQRLQRGQGPLFSRTLVSAVGMSALGLGRVKTQSRANRREQYSFGSPLCEREEHTELRRRGIREADSLPFARFHVFTQPGSETDSQRLLRHVC